MLKDYESEVLIKERNENEKWEKIYKEIDNLHRSFESIKRHLGLVQNNRRFIEVPFEVIYGAWKNKHINALELMEIIINSLGEERFIREFMQEQLKISLRGRIFSYDLDKEEE